MTNEECSGECTAGYYCPEASTGPQQAACGIGPNPVRYYCPAGTSTRVLVSDGYYTTPESAAETHRLDQVACTELYACFNGTR